MLEAVARGYENIIRKIVANLIVKSCYILLRCYCITEQLQFFPFHKFILLKMSLRTMSIWPLACTQKSAWGNKKKI